ERELDYWRTRLTGVEPLNLPVDHPRSAVGGHPVGWVTFRVPEELSEQVVRMSRREGATRFMVVLAAWKSLLGRYSGHEDFGIGTAMASRSHLETEGLVGFFVNTLVIRTRAGRRRGFRDYLEEVKRVVLEGYGHQNIPFEKLVEEVSTERDLKRSP